MADQDLREIVDEALSAMPWLTPADDALRALALRLAVEIDTARARAAEFGLVDGLIVRDTDEDLYFRVRRLEAWCDLAKAVGLLGPRLRDVLRDLGGAPGSRQGLNTGAGKTAGKLATLRANSERFELIRGGEGA